MYVQNLDVHMIAPMCVCRYKYGQFYEDRIIKLIKSEFSFHCWSPLLAVFAVLMNWKGLADGVEFEINFPMRLTLHVVIKESKS
jgi:hypothetical protein